MKGSIKLVYKGETVRQLNFATDWQRETIIYSWKKLYGKKFMNAKVVTTYKEDKSCSKKNTIREISQTIPFKSNKTK